MKQILFLILINLEMTSAFAKDVICSSIVSKQVRKYETKTVNVTDQYFISFSIQKNGEIVNVRTRYANESWMSADKQLISKGQFTEKSETFAAYYSSKIFTEPGTGNYLLVPTHFQKMNSFESILRIDFGETLGIDRIIEDITFVCK